MFVNGSHALECFRHGFLEVCDDQTESSEQCLAIEGNYGRYVGHSCLPRGQENLCGKTVRIPNLYIYLIAF